MGQRILGGNSMNEEKQKQLESIAAEMNSLANEIYKLIGHIDD